MEEPDLLLYDLVAPSLCHNTGKGVDLWMQYQDLNNCLRLDYLEAEPEIVIQVSWLIEGGTCQGGIEENSGLEGVE